MIAQSFRRALSDSDLGNYINDNFVFVGTSVEHGPSNKLLGRLGLRPTVSPIFAVLCPRVIADDADGPLPVIKELSLSGSVAGSSSRPRPADVYCESEVAAVLKLAASDVTPDKIHRFLQR